MISAGAILEPNDDGALLATANVTVNGRLGIDTANLTIDGLNGSSAGVVTLYVSSATLTLGACSGSGSFAGVISAAISLIKNGGGTQILSGISTYTGATTIRQGTLAVSGSIASKVWNIEVRPALDATNFGLLNFTSGAPALAGVTVNIAIAESGTGLNWKAVSWNGTPTGSPALRVNGVPVTSGVATPGGTTVTFSASGISVSRATHRAEARLSRNPYDRSEKTARRVPRAGTGKKSQGAAGTEVSDQKRYE